MERSDKKKVNRMYGFNEESKLCKPIASVMRFGSHIQGSSLTIPNLAPSLREIIAASLHGEGAPVCGTPQFDESESAGLARIAVPTNIVDFDAERDRFAQETPKPSEDGRVSDEDKPDLSSGADEEAIRGQDEDGKKV